MSTSGGLIFVVFLFGLSLNRGKCAMWHRKRFSEGDFRSGKRKTLEIEKIGVRNLIFRVCKIYNVQSIQLIRKSSRASSKVNTKNLNNKAAMQIENGLRVERKLAHPFIPKNRAIIIGKRQYIFTFYIRFPSHKNNELFPIPIRNVPVRY